MSQKGTFKEIIRGGDKDSEQYFKWKRLVVYPCGFRHYPDHENYHGRLY